MITLEPNKDVENLKSTERTPNFVSYIDYPNVPSLEGLCANRHMNRMLIPWYWFDPKEFVCEECKQPIVSLRWGGLHNLREACAT
jgi:hypothetical protein